MNFLSARNLKERRELMSMTTVVHHMPSKMLQIEMVHLSLARILKDMAEITKYLDSFSKLKGYTITENQHAKPPGGSLFGRFKQKWDSLPRSQRVTCLAFHGTADNNISSICQNGYDPKLRSGQAYGVGEYFATTPDIPLGYCRGGGKRMLLNELLLGQQGTHHTVHSTVVVMKDPAHDLPRFVVTFK